MAYTGWPGRSSRGRGNFLRARSKSCVTARSSPISIRGPAFDAELQAHVQATLSRHEYPRVIEVVDALPKTPAGKVNRKALRDRA